MEWASSRFSCSGSRVSLPYGLAAWKGLHNACLQERKQGSAFKGVLTREGRGWLGMRSTPQRGHVLVQGGKQQRAVDAFAFAFALGWRCLCASRHCIESD